jgi:hypothetical protein
MIIRKCQVNFLPFYLFTIYLHVDGHNVILITLLVYLLSEVVQQPVHILHIKLWLNLKHINFNKLSRLIKMFHALYLLIVVCTIVFFNILKKNISKLFVYFLKSEWHAHKVIAKRLKPTWNKRAMMALDRSPDLSNSSKQLPRQAFWPSLMTGESKMWPLQC